MRFIMAGLFNQEDLVKFFEFIEDDVDLWEMFDHNENLIWNKNYKDRTLKCLQQLSERQYRISLKNNDFLEKYKEYLDD